MILRIGKPVSGRQNPERITTISAIFIFLYKPLKSSFWTELELAATLHQCNLYLSRHKKARKSVPPNSVSFPSSFFSWTTKKLFILGGIGVECGEERWMQQMKLVSGSEMLWYISRNSTENNSLVKFDFFWWLAIYPWFPQVFQLKRLLK